MLFTPNITTNHAITYTSNVVAERIKRLEASDEIQATTYAHFVLFQSPLEISEGFFSIMSPSLGSNQNKVQVFLLLLTECTLLISRVHAQRNLKLLASSQFRVVGAFNNKLLLLFDIKMLHV